MHLLFDDAGKPTTGRILSEADNSLQVELDSGKRVKVKSANAWLRFDKPEPSALMSQALALQADMELPLAYEFAPEDEFDFAALAGVYFDDTPSAVQQAAALLCLQSAPHYFRRMGKGRFKKAPADILAQALVAIEKKQQVQAQIEAWAAELVAGTCPDPVRAQLYKILFKPDKNSPEYKAVVQAARGSHTAPLTLLLQSGAIENAYEFHWQRFLFEHFPKGTGFGELAVPSLSEALPLADVQAFSIDDSQTTEIDDALSVQGLGTGCVTLGIHIAAPALSIAPDSALDQIARQRMSTIYMPGHKITMLPDTVVQAFTLQAGQACPAVSLYVRIDETSLAVIDSHTRLERVPIADNLRHDQIDHIVTEAWLQGEPNPEAPAEAQRWQASLSWLHDLAKHLKAAREVVRGKPETFNRPDHTFKLDGVGERGPQGHETVVMGLRQRGAPLDLIVAEAMIVANSTWGQWLAQCGVPGIYRSQASLSPGIKVRMGAKALPHAGIGVPAYAWSTSPLRRYVDMVNQWQIIACVRHGATAALVAPFKPKDANLLAVIGAFDAAYGAYNDFQRGMERYWTLKYLEQNGITELDATLIKEQLVRADTLPLVMSVMGADGWPRGAQARVRLGRSDLMALDISATVVARLDNPDSTDDDALIDPEDDDAVLTTPVALAIEVDEAEPPVENPAP
ncbi:Ribonuclease II/R [Burkholderiaceae bacterium]